MNELVEVRGTNVAFELRNGARVEYAANDRETRMRSLGCPEKILKQLREHRSVKRSTKAAPARPFTEAELAELNGWTIEQYRVQADSERLRRAAALGREIARDADADLRKRAAHAAAVIAADAAKDARDEEWRRRMENAAGRISR